MILRCEIPRTYVVHVIEYYAIPNIKSYAWIAFGSLMNESFPYAFHEWTSSRFMWISTANFRGLENRKTRTELNECNNRWKRENRNSSSTTTTQLYKQRAESHADNLSHCFEKQQRTARKKIAFAGNKNGQNKEWKWTKLLCERTAFFIIIIIVTVVFFASADFTTYSTFERTLNFL